MTTLQKFNKTLGDFDQEVQKLSATAQIFAKIENLAARQLEIQDQFAEQNERLAQYNSNQTEQKEKLDEDFKGLLQALEAQKLVFESQKQFFESQVAELLAKQGEQKEENEKVLAALYTKLSKQFEDVKAAQSNNKEAVMTYFSEKIQKMEKDNADSFNEVIKSANLRFDDNRKDLKGFTERELLATKESLQGEITKMSNQFLEFTAQQNKSIKLLMIFNIVLVVALFVVIFIK